MTPYDYQLQLAEDGYAVLKKHMLVYLAVEERVGKTLASILICEKCESVKTVLVVTKKKALDGWHETLAAYPHNKKYTVTNYHQVKKFGRHDLIIVDEAQNYISGFPKQPAIHKAIKNISSQVPIIYLSATPHAQGYSMLYHQLSLSTWSPWATYKDFFAWFRVYGIPSSAWFNGRQVPLYNDTQESLVKSCIDHLFITKTRRELGFKYEPKDKLHYVVLSKSTRDIYNEVMKDKYYTVNDAELICDTSMKLRTSLHMLEGGVLKIDDGYFVLHNREKIDFILKQWGDSDDLVIYYHYIAEGRKLRAIFKNAAILQASSFAEGIDLAEYKTIVIYSQDFSTARHTQRRARQAAKHRTEPIIVHFLLVEKGISEQVYNTVAVNKTNFVDSLFQKDYL